MKRAVLSRRASLDMDGLYDYIAQFSRLRAEKMIHRISVATRRLARNPYLGADCSERGLEMRFWSVKPYVVYYLATSYGIEVHRVLHSSQDADAELA